MAAATASAAAASNTTSGRRSAAARALPARRYKRATTTPNGALRASLPALAGPLAREQELRSEVPVERHLGDACIGDDPIDPDRVQPEAREQPVRRLEESFVRQGCLVGRRHALIGSMRQTCLYRTST